MLLLAIVSAWLDPITSTNVIARIRTDVSCSGTCKLVVASLQHVNGDYAASARGSECGETLQLDHVPFGARLTPRVTFSCDGTVRSESGPALTLAPYLTNVSIADGTIWVPALAEPRGDERVRLRVRGDGFDVSQDFATRELVIRNVNPPTGRLYVSATLEPWGIASNTRVVFREEPSAHFVATGVGCDSGMSILPLVFFRRRRFPFPRGFC